MAEKPKVHCIQFQFKIVLII